MKTTEIYKGIEITIWNDEMPMNPFEDWDGCIPLISRGDGYGKDYSDGEILNFLRSFLTYNQVKRNQKRLLDLMDYDVKDFREDYPLEDYDRTEMIQDDILYDWLSDDTKNMKEFCIEFEIAHYTGVSRGYSQGDWADVFMCWTPQFETVTGRSHESMEEKDFKSGFDLYTSWAWGDVYGYTVEEFEDSCAGFYGDDHKASGLMEYAENVIDCGLEERKTKKANKLKTCIKNNVPLSYRSNLLETTI